MKKIKLTAKEMTRLLFSVTVLLVLFQVNVQAQDTELVSKKLNVPAWLNMALGDANQLEGGLHVYQDWDTYNTGFKISRVKIGMLMAIIDPAGDGSVPSKIYQLKTWGTTSSIPLQNEWEEFSTATLPEGTANGTTLRWNGTGWEESAAFKNDGINLAATGDLYLGGDSLILEGDTPDNYQLVLKTNPTADRTITLPNATGTVALTSDIVALPSGTANQTLRHTGSNWVASSALTNNGTNVTTTGDLTVGGGDLTFSTGGTVTFEGSTPDANETNLQVTDPTADRTITFPNASGTVALTTDIGPFKTTSNITSNAGGDLTNDDFVFGSDSLNYDNNTAHAARMFFDKSKSAFRAGYANNTNWNESNIGIGSAAFGRFSKASGSASFAMGNTTSASGGYSTAMGYNTRASGDYSTAMGNYTTASGSYSFALGSGATASGNFSTAMGFNTTAASYASLAIGQYNTGGGTASSWVDTDPLFEIGNGTSTSRSNALTVYKNGNTDISGNLTIGAYTLPGTDGAGGQVLQTNGSGTVSWGKGGVVFTTTSNITSNAGGDLTNDDFVFGSDSLNYDNNTAHAARMFFDKSKSAFRAGYANNTNWDESNIGIGSAAFGRLSKASGSDSFATGYSSVASGTSSTAIGASITASGNYATAMGLATTAASYASLAIGRYNTGTGTADSWEATDPLFEIGNGISNASRSNALTVYKNGNTEIAGSLTVNEGRFYGKNSELIAIGFTDGIINFFGNDGTNDTDLRFDLDGNAPEIYSNTDDAVQISDKLLVTGNLYVANTPNYGYTWSVPGTTYQKYLYPSTNNTTGTTTTINDAAGVFKGVVLAEGGVFVSSDRRIKNILDVSDSKKDMETLEQIEITDYTYKDPVTNDGCLHKKVIAQQVENVYPIAVSRGEGEVPDIMQTAGSLWTQGNKVNLELATDSVKAGDKLKIIYEKFDPATGKKTDGASEIVTVDSYQNGVITYQSTNPGFIGANTKAFVYGHQVNDFRTVDYEAIAMLNVSATQELHKQLKELQETSSKQIAALSKQITALSTQNKQLQEQLAALLSKNNNGKQNLALQQENEKSPLGD